MVAYPRTKSGYLCTYPPIDDAASHIKSVGSGCFLAKTDTRMPVASFQFHHLNTVFWVLHGGICFALISACLWVPLALVLLLKPFNVQSKLHIKHILHLLDALLFLESSELNCTNTSCFQIFALRLGSPWLQRKLVVPSTICAQYEVMIKNVQEYIATFLH